MGRNAENVDRQWHCCTLHEAMEQVLSSPATLTVGLVQMRCCPVRQENTEKAIAMVHSAARQGAEVVCLPELFQHYPSRFTRDRESIERVQSIAETIPGPTTEILADIARQCRVVLVGGSLVERGSDGKIYNTAPLLSETGELLGKHRKLHIPHYDPLFYEQDYFAPGDLGVQVFQTQVGRIAMSICFDQWHVQTGQLAGLQGADLLLAPMATGMQPTTTFADGKSVERGYWPEMWVHMHRAQAVLNMIAVGAANRVGDEGELVFFGNSPIIDYAGRNVVEPQRDREAVIVGHINLERMRMVRRGLMLPTFARLDLLEEVERLTRAQGSGRKIS